MIIIMTILEIKFANNLRYLGYLINFTIMVTLVFNQVFAIDVLLKFYSKKENTATYYLYNNLYSYWITEFILFFS